MLWPSNGGHLRITKKLDKIVDKYLQIWYSILNSECFDNKLPRDLDVQSARIKGLRGGTPTQGRRALGIFVDPRDTQLVSVLLHEMCHVYQAEVMGYGDGSPEHDHHFWHLVKVSQRKLDRAINTIHFN